jgi:hypothetical protein
MSLARMACRSHLAHLAPRRRLRCHAASLRLGRTAGSMLRSRQGGATTRARKIPPPLALAWCEATYAAVPLGGLMEGQRRSSAFWKPSLLRKKPVVKGQRHTPSGRCNSGLSLMRRISAPYAVMSALLCRTAKNGLPKGNLKCSDE